MEGKLRAVVWAYAWLRSDLGGFAQKQAKRTKE